MQRTLWIIVLLFAAAAGAQAQGWEDNFDAPALNARWTWRVPVPGPTMSLTERPGWLRIHLPEQVNGFNHWNQPQPVDAAPQLRTPVPAGDWELEAHVVLQEYPPTSNFHLGVVAGMSDARIVVWGPFFGPGLQGGQQAPEVWLEPTGTSGFGKARVDARDVTLRLTKIGKNCLAAVRVGEGDWVEGGTYTFPEAPRFLGLIGKTFLDGPGVTFDVDSVRLIPREPRAEPPVDATVRVDAKAKPVAISPLRFGHFIEHLGRCIYGGLWAEMLANRKLGGAPGATGVVERWTPVGDAPGAAFAPDHRVFYAPVQSQRISHAGAGEACGISQSGLALRPGVGIVGRVVLRREGEIGPVTVALRAGEKTLGEQQIPEVGADWQTFPVTFPAPEARVADASFAITFTGAGTLWVGAASLMPADNLDGWRRDVVELAKAIRPAVLRWPGGNMASGYHWDDGIGPQDRRPVRWERAWGAWEPNDVGTHEFLRLCELLGAQPYLVANAGAGEAGEAARWVEYCNAADTAQARLRAENGHPAPFAVRLWSLGNEMYGDWEIGHLPATAYALRALEFARAMRAVDPQIKLVGVGVEGDGYANWNRSVLAVLGPELDYLSIHHYQPLDPGAGPLGVYAAQVGGAADLERALQEAAAQVTAAAPAGKRISLALDEWNVWPKDATPQNGMEVNHTLGTGLWACSVLNVLTRQGEHVGLANLALLVNVLGAIRTTPTDAYVTPVYLAFRMNAEHSGSARLPATVECPNAPLPGGRDLPALDAAATVSADGGKIYLSLVNRHPLRPVRVKLDVPGFAPASGEWAALVGEEITTVNTLEAPQAVHIDARPLKPEELKGFVVPPHCAVVVTLDGGAPAAP